MFVTKIVGSCPKCNAEHSFGNVLVTGQTLRRGCMKCQFTQKFLLPELSKVVIYLDQCFFSHAFRAKAKEFVEGLDLISELAQDQLLVCPVSSVHETETHQWRDTRAKDLWQFIKKTSRGHAFEPAYHVRYEQITRSFRMFIEGESSVFPLSRGDVLDDVNVWEDYYWIDVGGMPQNIDLTRRLKREATEGLVGLFAQWRRGERSFAEHLDYEIRSGGEGYIQLYLEQTAKLARGDFNAILASPVDTQIVGAMVRLLDDQRRKDALNVVQDFFNSEFYANVPYAYISAGIMTALRDQVGKGHFPNSQKAVSRLQGLFFDMEFIASYAPYCDAMFVDTAMLPLVNDDRLQIKERYGVRLFAKSNWEEFMAYLDSIRSRKTPELKRAVELVYPDRNVPSAKD